MGSFTDDLRAALHEMTEAGERYWTTAMKSADVEHVTTVPLDEHRWYTVKLDVYRRKTDGTLAGVTWQDPASEIQEDQDRNATVVEVEAYITTSYRVSYAMPSTPTVTAEDGERRGERAHSGYFTACAGKSLMSGAELPSWGEQAPEIRAAWVAAAEAVRETP